MNYNTSHVTASKTPMPTQPGHPSVGRQHEYWQWLNVALLSNRVPSRLKYVAKFERFNKKHAKKFIYGKRLAEK